MLALALLASCGDDDLFAPEAYPQRFAEVAAGEVHTCATSVEGDTYCWGSAAESRLGHRAVADYCDGAGCIRPAPVRAEPRFTSLSAGGAHTCGLFRGRAWCWGFDRFGQLGDDHTVLTRCADNTPFRCSLDPALVAIGTPLVRITADRHHSCALTEDGRALCWGWNVAGQLGRGTKDGGDPEARHPDPQVVGGDLRFVDLETGFGHTCGIDEVGAAWCWGSNEVGRLGTGDLEERLVPAPVTGGLAFTRIAAGGSFSCGITPDGTVFCWGWGWEGRLGTGDMYDRTEPTHTQMPEPAQAISAGQHHACAIGLSGALYCWGPNHQGQLGIATPGHHVTPQRVPLPAPVARVSAGFTHTCAITVDQELYCWGDNAAGQLGVGNTAEEYTSTPMPVNP